MSALEIKAAEPATLPLADLKRDPELQCRARGTQRAAVAEYAEAMSAGATFPPIAVFRDPKGVLWLSDGFHRVEAAELAGIAELPADVREGSRKDALLFAASANAGHGLRRTTADKRRAIGLLLGNFPRLSDRKIAEAAGVDHKTVAAARRALSPEGGEIPQEQKDAEPTEAEQQPTPSDATVERLSKALQRLLAQWPPERRAELQSLVATAVGGPTT